MSTIEQIVDAASRLIPTQVSRLRKRLDVLEERAWRAERRRVAEQLKAKGISDADIDRAIMRRRREGHAKART